MPFSRQERERAVRAEREAQDSLLRNERRAFTRDMEAKNFEALLAEALPLGSL